MRILVSVLVVGLIVSSPSLAARAQNSKVGPEMTVKGKESSPDGPAQRDERNDPPAPAGDVRADADAASESAAANSSAPPTSIYRVGVGDVLDVRLLNQGEQRESTLYSVMAGGLLAYPLAGGPLVVAGLTTDEVGARLAVLLKRRAVFDRPQLVVSVREYASHSVLVSGLVDSPGTKILRREAMPLYVIIAESQPKPEAGRATVIARATGQSTVVNLDDPASANVLVRDGDVINLTARPKPFIFIGGEVYAPGQKDFHAGITLTQAVLAAGGVVRGASSKVKVSRQGANGRLSRNEYKLKDIQRGKIPDPLLQAGDRIEVGR